MLQVAMIGADVDPIAIGSINGWTGRTPTITFVVWAPATGVVFEADSSDATVTPSMLSELAASVEPVDLDQWRADHPGLLD